MVFLGTVIETVLKMIIVGAVAFGGIMLGRHLRKKHDEKQDEN